MNTNSEQVPTTWTTADETFFRIVDGVLSPAYTAGASVLLSTYDGDCDPSEVRLTTSAAPPSPSRPIRAIGHSARATTL